MTLEPVPAPNFIRKLNQNAFAGNQITHDVHGIRMPVAPASVTIPSWCSMRNEKWCG